MSFLDSIANKLGYVKPKRQLPKPPMARSMSGFAAADTGRLFNDWNSSDGSIDSFLKSQLKTIRTRARQLARDDDYAKKFLALQRNNVIGPNGINLQMDVVDPNGTQDINACDKIEKAWDEWSKPDNCTVTKSLSRVEAEQLILECAARDGEFIVRIVEGFDNPFRFALQIIEADYLDHDYNTVAPNGNEVRLGIEFNKWRQPVAGYFFTKNPIDSYAWGGYSSQRERIDFSDIIHGFIRIHPEQSRGVSWLHTAMPRLKMLNGFEEAALVAARIGASKMGFIEQTPDANNPYTGDSVDAEGNQVSEVQPGQIEVLALGQKFSSFDPAYPNTEHLSFTKGMLRGAACGLGVSYNALTSDLESVNYSSLRAGALEDRDGYRTTQNWLINTLHLPLFPRWLKMCLLTQQIPLPASKFDKFNKPKFKGRSWSWVDPLKDQKANIAAIESALKTRGEIIAEEGGDFEETMRNIQREEQIAARYAVDLSKYVTNPLPEPAADPNQNV